ncbi:MAG: glycosyltransferase, partial [Carbonactinosporaceae bacterium]
MAVKVSVVVPVYNPGPHIDECVASILRQSLPTGEYEAVFVDDGSTDGTGERLDRFAAEHPGVIRVIHIPNSGWPGRPRNIGVDNALGKYVYFVDNDDYIGEEALERLYAFAEKNNSDIVVGKMAGNGRSVPRHLFRRTRERASLDKDPLLAILTPHKLFRREFLGKHHIRFPEGRRRLEDHVFVVKAYFCADVISILSDYVCYYWIRRDDDTNASHDRIDPHGYFANMREVLDIVEEHTEPGAFRDRMLAHWYRNKVLRRVGGQQFISYPRPYRREIVEVLQGITLERFGAGVHRNLRADLRVRSALLRDGDTDQLTALSRAESGIAGAVRLDGLDWEDGAFVLRMTGRLAYRDGSPLTFTREGDRLLWDLPPGVRDSDVITPDDRDVTRELAQSRINVFVRSRSDRSELVVPAKSNVAWQEEGPSVTVSVVGQALLDPLKLAAGAPMGAGVWDVYTQVAACGWESVVRPGGERDASVPERPPPGIVGDPARVMIPFWTTAGNLSLDLDQSARTLVQGLRPDGVDASFDGSSVAVSFAIPDLHCQPGVTANLALELSAEPSGAGGDGDGVRPVSVPAVLAAGGGSAVSGGSATPADRFGARLPYSPAEAGVGPGSWRLVATVGRSTARLPLTLDIAQDGTPTVRK